MEKKSKETLMYDIGYVKAITIGSVNPNVPLAEGSVEKQAELLNKCLNSFPKGRIIGKDCAIGAYNVGGHQLMMEKTTYHVGFARKPSWITNEK
jgi:hypothetical protein